MTRSRRLFLFDIDGTLIGSPGGVGRRAFERACASAAGIENALAGVTLGGNTDPYILEEAFQARRGRRPTEKEVEAVLAEYLCQLRVELETPGAVRVLPSVKEALAAAAAAGMVGLATGNLEMGARLKLERAGLWHHFPFGGFGSDAGERAELVRVAIRRAEERAGTRLAPDSVWVIGDTPRDVAAARAAGVRSVAVATGSHDVEALRRTGADEVHATLATWAAALGAEG